MWFNWNHLRNTEELAKRNVQIKILGKIDSLSFENVRNVLAINNRITHLLDYSSENIKFSNLIYKKLGIKESRSAKPPLRQRKIILIIHSRFNLQ